jgi:hypothetical protein
MSYEVVISRSADLREPLVAKVREPYFRPLRPLTPGKIWWRYRPMPDGSPGEWSKVLSFDLGAGLPRWELPDWKTLAARVPKGHPRIFLRPEDVAGFRKKASGPLKAEVERWRKEMEKHYNAPFSLASYEAEARRAVEQRLPAVQIRVKKRWAARFAGEDLMDPVPDLCWLWLATGEERAAAEAKRRVLMAAELDPNGFLSNANSDFGNIALVSGSAIAYDMLYDRFSAEERAKIRAMLLTRTAPAIEEMIHPPRGLMDGHAWQHTFIKATQSALALYGEEPIAERWLELGWNNFAANYPWFGGSDGGSQEGVHYYAAMELISSLNTRDLFYSAFGVDFAKEIPWYRANPYYLMYAYPPGSVSSKIGDNSKDLFLTATKGFTPPGANEKLAALRMYGLYGNGHAADYAARIPATVPGSGEWFRWALTEPLQRTPIESLSPARVFRDIGVVFMHSAFGRPEDNVRMEFRSSPFGGSGHGHADQNTFHIIAYNEPLVIESGYYTPGGDPHRSNWYIQTKSHNGILVDGTGQPDEPNGYGEIRHFEQNADWVYAIGAAPAAYKEVKLERFDRHIVWLRGETVQTYVIVDDIATADGKPHRFDWLLHARERMQIDARARRILIQGDKGQALVSLVEPAQLSFEQDDKFDSPAVNWRRGGGNTPLKNQWHLKAAPPPASRQRFAAVIQVAKHGTEWPAIGTIPDGVRIGKWSIQLIGDPLAINPVP